MAAKAILVICAQAILIQSAFNQCISPAAVDATGFAFPYGLNYAYDGQAYDGLAYDNFATGAPFGFPGYNRAYDGFIPDAPRPRGLSCASPAMEISPTAGGLLPVTSSSAIPPVGISIISENAFEGLLAVTGEIPFVGTTAMEGALPTDGAGAINYGCGNGVTAMVSDTAAPVATFTPAAIGSAAIAPATVIAPGYSSVACFDRF